MQTKYSNPYFKNPEMRDKLLQYIKERKPKLEPNNNLNLVQETDLPVTDLAADQTNQSWIKFNSIS